jgi:uncharacterized protein YggU (UPF0235/DUF167 family)
MQGIFSLLALIFSFFCAQRKVFMTVILTLKVTPRAKQVKLTRNATGTIICHIKISPEKNKANNELIALIAHLLHIAQSHVRIIHGLQSRTKKIEITTALSYDQTLCKLNIPYQYSLDSGNKS